MKQKEIEDKILKMIIKLDRDYWKANPNEKMSYEIIENFKMKSGETLPKAMKITFGEYVIVTDELFKEEF